MTGEDAEVSVPRPRALTRSRLPAWASLLAVVAHPDDESFGLGGVIASFTSAGTRAAVLCLTHGEASTVHGIEGDLHAVRAQELASAATSIGVSTTVLLDYPDGGLAAAPTADIVADVVSAAHRTRPDGLLVFDPSGVTGHPDHAAATDAALLAAEVLDLPVLGWTLPAPVAATLNAERGATFTGHALDDIDVVVSVDRARQYAAISAHVSQAVPGSVLWRRLELLGSREYMRMLRTVCRPRNSGGGRAASYTPNGM